jgi:copper oxidase (laccase) domain-containing protein
MPERMRAYVSPCIGVDNFEVGPEVAVQFDDAFVERRPAWRRPHVDLKAAIVAQLAEAGVPREQVEVSPHCTVADVDLFFSHRAENGVTGRMMGFVGLREDTSPE